MEKSRLPGIDYHRLTKRTMALVLAGGTGSRLHALTRWQAKPALPIAGSYRNIDFTLSNCVNSGIRRIGILTQYKAHTLIQHLAKAWNFLHPDMGECVELWPAQQRCHEQWYNGTADAVFQNLDLIDAHAPDYLLVLAGDHIYKMDYGPLLAQHIATRADVTIASIEVPIAIASQFGIMQIEADHRIKKFVEKPTFPEKISHDSKHAVASMGIYVFSTQYLRERLIEDSIDETSNHDFGRDLIPDAVQNGNAFSFPFCRPDGQPGYWRDVGTLDAYWQTNMDLLDDTPPLNLYENSWPIRTFQEQLPPAKFIFRSDRAPGTASHSMVSSGCILDGASVIRSMLFTNVRIGSESLVADSIILPGARIGRRCRLRRVIVESGCEIPDDSVIGEDHDADSVRHLVSPDGVVLVCHQSIQPLPHPAHAPRAMHQVA